MRFVLSGALVASTLAIAAVAAPASAQTLSPVSGYVNLGLSRAALDPFDINAAHLRAGARFGRYLGAEGEAGVGLNTDDAAGVSYKLKHTFGAYGVGFLPLSPNADLFVRAGVATSSARIDDGVTRISDSAGSFNYGAGGQFFFNGNNGIRAEYTRVNVNNSPAHADTWALSYVRRF